jgi:Reverse transcriptase (RNA-dependent DNA polymerase)
MPRIDPQANPYTTDNDFLRPLVDPITMAELKTTVFSIPKDKAVGPDEFPIEFFHHYWDIIWEDLYRAVSAFYHNKLDLWRINEAYIALIPKKSSATIISDFRPISVLSAIPKIITKILATRLQPYVPLLVDKHRTTFTKGRHLMQTFLSTHEMLHHLSRNRIPSVLLKLDFHKAFDNISWSFLLKVLRVRGFPPVWIAWVTNLLISSTSFLKINGLRGTLFYHRRGLRQGDPLSLLLFILATDILQTTFKRLENDLLSLPTVSTTVLQFADDTAIITLAHPRNLKIIITTLILFGRSSGLQINLSKSGFLPVSIPDDLLPITQSLLRCQ